MVEGKQLATLPRRVRAYVLRLEAEKAWQQIADLMSLTAPERLAIAEVMAYGNDQHGKCFREISVAKSQ